MIVAMRLKAYVKYLSKIHSKLWFLCPSDKLVQDETKFQERIRENCLNLLKKLETKLVSERKSHDSSMYTGTAGTALLYWRLSTIYPDSDYIEKALNLVEFALPSLKLRTMSFLCGEAGILALGVVLYHKNGNSDMKNKLLKKLENFGDEVYQKYDPSTANEILYGRAGYLYSLLFVNAQCSESIVDSKIISKMVNLIVTEGQRAKRPYLYYDWHDKCYFGAAHGILGIVYILLKQKQDLNPDGLDAVRKTIDWMLTQRFPSGNVPSSLNSQSDNLVHWCHGAPGAIYIFIEAHKVYKDERYLNAAKDCANVIWEKGFLKKGYSLCHGVSGNAYGLMAMYTHTKENKYLKQAYLMAEWCFDYGSKANRAPDRPLSLFEGLAGVVYMLADFGSNSTPNFPAFQL